MATFTTLYSWATIGHRVPRPTARRATRLAIETLEDRLVPALVASQVLAGGAPAPAATTDPAVISSSDVSALLSRAAAATSSDDAIIAIVDRSGHILGVRVEGNVSKTITNSLEKRVFAIDGAVAEARTAAFFANNQAPLTSRTIGFISQSTNTQREVESDPTITDPNSTLGGPGFVAAVGVNSHFPPDIALTPQVDLFDIEHTNRDSSPVDANGNQIGTRFNVDPKYLNPAVPASMQLASPDSYGVISGLEPNALPRGIGTLPGGIPIYNSTGSVVGGIGVFFPGTTGYATAENSSLSETYNPKLPDRSLEAEYIAFAAVGGAPMLDKSLDKSGPIGGVALPPDLLKGLPITPQNQRIDLVGITLDIVGPGGTQGPYTLAKFGNTFKAGNPNSGADVRVKPLAAGSPITMATSLISGTAVPDGWLVEPHAGVGLTAADVTKIVTQAIQQAEQTRAAIRLPLDSRAKMVITVTDTNGNVLGLYRMPDATVFSIDVAVAKGRNVAYYADPNQLQAIDKVDGVPAGTAMTNRTFRYLTQPRFPEGIDGSPPGQFSILNDPGTNPLTGLNVGPALPAKDYYNTVEGNDAFNQGTNFHQPKNKYQDGIVFFPGSVPLYKNGKLVGGLGVSGDGVDQDDVVTQAGAVGYGVPSNVLTADQTFTRGVRLPYQKSNRNPDD